MSNVELHDAYLRAVAEQGSDPDQIARLYGAETYEDTLRPHGVEEPPHGLVPAKITTLDGTTVPTRTTG
jgi:hypothetical protein